MRKEQTKNDDEFEYAIVKDLFEVNFCFVSIVGKPPSRVPIPRRDLHNEGWQFVEYREDGTELYRRRKRDGEKRSLGGEDSGKILCGD